MPMAKLDLLDDKTVATSVNRLGPSGQEASGAVSGDGEQAIVIAFNVGDPENAANWSRVGLLLKEARKNVRFLTMAADQKAFDRVDWVAVGL